MSDWKRAQIRLADGEEVEVDAYPGMVNSIRVGSVFGDSRFWMESHQARALAAQLIAAADYAEGVTS